MKRSVLSLVALLLSILSLEGLLHLFIAAPLGVPLQERIPGTTRDYRWCGKVHNFNANGFRGPPLSWKAPGVTRIVVIGDSLTYGYGVSYEEAYPAKIAEMTGYDVVNLGASGLQSQHIVGIARNFVAQLEPDLVVYGVCLNDFLPAGTDEYSTRGFDARNTWIATHSRLGALAAVGFEQFLLKTGLAPDFFDDILSDFGGYATRFRSDMGELEQILKVPVVGMVLNQYPADPRGRKIGRIAEAAMRQAGIIVVPSDPYLDAMAAVKPVWNVNRFEGHPNVEAHRIFATELSNAIEAL